MHKERLRKSLMDSNRRKQLDPLNSDSILTFTKEQDKHTMVMSINRDKLDQQQRKNSTRNTSNNNQA